MEKLLENFTHSKQELLEILLKMSPHTIPHVYLFAKQVIVNDLLL